MVLVSHPHAASVANECAAALARRNLLSLYATGVASTGGPQSKAAAWICARFPQFKNRLVEGLDRPRLRSLGCVEFAARGVARASHGLLRTYDALFWSHDRAVAMMHWPATTRAVYAYEDGALATFLRARKHGIARIWDLPAPHYRSRERVSLEEPARWTGAESPQRPEPEWKRWRKDRELELATGVLSASEYTRTTLRLAGYDGPVEVVPYGFPVQLFPAKREQVDGPFTVLAVGTQSLAKGTQYLLEAWRLAGVAGRLRLVGEMRLEQAFLHRYAGLFEHVPHVPRVLLGAEYRRADLVVFPSLGDGFGLVIQEAMCSGTPVIATSCSGGPECIRSDEHGWLVQPASVDALVDHIRLAASDRERLRAMGLAAREHAERWSWLEAGTALAAAVERLAAC